jgi:hypothetical protein
MIEGHLLFPDLKGSIRRVEPPVVEIAAALPVGEVPLVVPIETMTVIGPDLWRVTARAYVSRT